jgi:hypothetical protein
MKRIILALAILLMTASFAAADTIYLRDGRSVRGTLLGFINGRFVVRLEPRYTTQSDRNRPNEGEIQYFRPDEVERIEIEGRSLSDSNMEATTVQVALDPNWVDSGVNLRRNQRVQIDATGIITVGRSRISPDGLQRTDPTAPLPGANEGRLIGAIGDDSRAPIIDLGSSREFTADRDGRLYLTANRGSYSGAAGGFNVVIKRERGGDSGGGRPGRIRSRNRPTGDTGNTDNRTQERTITVPATSRGTDTGIEVRAGEQIYFTATGTIVAGQRVGQVGPDGGSSSGFGSINARPVPTAGVGALIAVIRMANGQLSQPYLVGSQLAGTVPVDGRLILLINDDNYNDNSGSFSVRIRY